MIILYDGKQLTKSNDIKDVVDMVVGVTGDERDYERVATIVGNMRLNEVFASPQFSIRVALSAEDNSKKVMPLKEALTFNGITEGRVNIMRESDYADWKAHPHRQPCMFSIEAERYLSGEGGLWVINAIPQYYQGLGPSMLYVIPDTKKETLRAEGFEWNGIVGIEVE